MVWAFALLEFPDFFLDGAWGDEAVGVDGAGLADAMGAVDGLGFDGGVPPGVVEDDVAGGGEIEAGAGGAEAEEEHGGVGIVLEALTTSWRFLVSPVRMWVGMLPLAFAFEDLSIWTNWLKTRTFWPSASSGSSSSKRVSVLPEAASLPTRVRVAADLAEPGEGGEDVDLLLASPFRRRFA
jgi:hypothetical protein